MRTSKTSHGERIVKDIKRKARKQYSAEEKIRIVLDGLRGMESVAELCRREGISQGIYYNMLLRILSRASGNIYYERLHMIRSMSSLAGDTGANISILNEKISIPDLNRLAQEMAKDSTENCLTVKASLYPFEVLSDVANILGKRLTVVY